MWNWFKKRRRAKILTTEFPPSWEEILLSNVGHYHRLNSEERQRLHRLIQVFVAEKTWEGCGGLVLTDEIRVTIAAQACMLILDVPHDYYRNVNSIFIYPSTVIAPERPVGFFEIVTEPRQGAMPILGQAHLRGPVVLVWDAVERTSKHPQSGHNVVYHEFAHKLDMMDGRANGTPVIHDPAQLRQWVEVCSREYLALRAQLERGEKTFLDSYGATHEAEFFAVATEWFFDQPQVMRDKHRELYEVLHGFYRQDPAKQENRT